MPWLRMRLWLHAGLAILLGASAGLGQAPWHWFPLYLLGLAGLFILWSRRGTAGALLLGWCFGLGYFYVGVHWVGQAFLVDAERFAWMMPLAIGFLAALLALFPALACGLARSVGGPPLGRALAFVSAWCFAEWLRGIAFTGFPWHHAAYLWTASDETMQAAALLGPHMLGLAAVALSVGLGYVVVAAGEPRRTALIWTAVSSTLVAGLAGYGVIRLQTVAGARYPEPYHLRIVQPAIAQAEKWRPELRDRHLANYLGLTMSPGEATPDLVIWPETATPFQLLRDGVRRDLISRSLPPGALLLTGTPRIEAGGDLKAFNSLVALDGNGRTTLLYDKRHLVPFGEYLPFRALLSRLGLDRLAVSPVDFSAGTLPAVSPLPGAPAVRTLICYEAIFPAESFTSMPRAAWLLNVTNDAWFGDSAGPRQHLAIARMRAVEQGLPLVRAANTGISALIDPFGRLLASLDIGERGVIDTTLPAPLPRPTLYARVGDAPTLALIAMLFVCAVLLRRRGKLSSAAAGS